MEEPIGMKVDESVKISYYQKAKRITIRVCESLQFLRFMCSGFIGTSIFYVVYELFIRLYPFKAYAATVCWAVSYFLSIIWQHALHRYLVFGWRGTSYFMTLFWTYISYSLSIVISPILMFILVDMVKLNYRWGWGITLSATGVFNYVTLQMANQRTDDSISPYQRNMFYFGYRIQEQVNDNREALKI